jgi:hypothetical protein
MSVEEPKKCAYQKSDGTDHEKALPHFACQGTSYAVEMTRGLNSTE